MKMLNKRGPRTDHCGTPRSILHHSPLYLPFSPFCPNQPRYALVEILFRLTKTRKIYSVKAIFSENHRAAPEGKLIYGWDIEIPCSYGLFGLKIHKKFGKKINKNGCLSLYFYWLFLPSNPVMAKWAYLRGDILTIVLGHFEIITQKHDNLSICIRAFCFFYSMCRIWWR